MNLLNLLGGYIVVASLIGCSIKHEESGGDDGGPPPPVSCEGVLEVEPNGEYEQAQLVTVLPQYSPDPICGEYVGVWEDVDFYKFWLQPTNPNHQIIFLNVVLETDKEISPYISFYQSEFDHTGMPTGDYQWLGTFFGEDGRVDILDFPVPYYWGSKMDLVLAVEHITPLPTSEAPYKLSFWN